MELLEQLTAIHSPSGSEQAMQSFILNYVKENQKHWKVQPTVHHGPDFQDCVVLVFGEPRTAVFAHMDTVGFHVQRSNHLVKAGKPKAEEGYRLVGADKQGAIEGKLKLAQNDNETPPDLICDFDRTIAPGTTLTFKPNFRKVEDYIQSPYMDDRLGVYNALKLAETLENGIICFSCWEEHGGGAVGYLTRFIYEQYGVRQALISDITWITDDIHHGKGVAVSVRDSGIPRRAFIDHVLKLAENSGIDYQVEVEGAGGSDGLEIQRSPYPVDWCFIGAGESNVHSPDEKVHRHDIDAMLKLYQYLMAKL